MRNIRVVIGKMVDVIPDEESVFVNRLLKLANDSAYQPPESNLYWHKLTAAVYNRIGNYPIEEWQYQVCALLSDKTTEDLKLFLEEHKDD